MYILCSTHSQRCWGWNLWAGNIFQKVRLGIWSQDLKQFLNPGTTDVFGCVIFDCGGCAVHYRTFNCNLAWTWPLPTRCQKQPASHKHHRWLQTKPNSPCGGKITPGQEPLTSSYPKGRLGFLTLNYLASLFIPGSLPLLFGISPAQLPVLSLLPHCAWATPNGKGSTSLARSCWRPGAACPGNRVRGGLPPMRWTGMCSWNHNWNPEPVSHTVVTTLEKSITFSPLPAATPTPNLFSLVILYLGNGTFHPTAWDLPDCSFSLVPHINSMNHDQVILPPEYFLILSLFTPSGLHVVLRLFRQFLIHSLPLTSAWLATI